MAYPHERLKSCKEVIRNQLSLVTEEAIKTALHKQDHRIISIIRNGENILTNTNIFTFNSSTIPKEIKIGFIVERVEIYVPVVWLLVGNLSTTRTYVEGNMSVASVEKKTPFETENE